MQDLGLQRFPFWILVFAFAVFLALIIIPAVFSNAIVSIDHRRLQTPLIRRSHRVLDLFLSLRT